ncbi:MAG: thimet oligopeptidase [Myxococcota bacterium]|jgi:thimet oligopeptidase
MTLRLLALAALTTLIALPACDSPDSRKPNQPALEAGSMPEAVAVPTAEAILADNTPTPPSTPVIPAEAGVAAPKRDLAAGDVAARQMLEAPEWANAERFQFYCEDSIARATVVRTKLQAGDLPKDQVVAHFAQLAEELDTVSGLMGLMFSVNPDKAVRDVAEKCEQDLSKFQTDVGLDRKLYDALSAVDGAALDPIAKRFVTHSLRDFRRAGVDKDEATRTRIGAIQAELTKAGQEFRKNVNEDVRSIKIDSVDDLAGLPEDYIANHKPGDDGKITITTNYPDFYPFETYVANAELREALYLAFSTRAFPANEALLKEILNLRKELTTLLGYGNWADYAAEDKMTGSAAVIEAFLTDIEKIVRPRSDKDIEVLLARKKKDQPKAEKIEVFDRFYYVAKVQEEQFDFDSKSVRPYFSYPKVKAGILDLYGDLFGLEFKRLADVKAWHPSVDAYEMLSDGQLVGRFFLDMHPRENKYKHAAAFQIQTGLANDRIPWASLVCNFPNPAEGDKKALMEHNQVVTFFHEFGHLIHHLLARRGTFVSLAGFNVEWDFVEAPSQILEEWAWDAKVLQRFAKHVDTGKAIPTALVKKMTAADEFGRGLSLMRQIFYASYSFFLHKADPVGIDLDAFTDGVYAKYSPYPRLNGGKVFANFGHLIGYSSIYYTYQWSLSIAKDLFTVFDEKGLLDKETAMAYRKHILEPGGTEDAETLVRNFLGRERNLDAYRGWIQTK